MKTVSSCALKATGRQFHRIDNIAYLFHRHWRHITFLCFVLHRVW